MATIQVLKSNKGGSGLHDFVSAVHCSGQPQRKRVRRERSRLQQQLQQLNEFNAVK